MSICSIVIYFVLLILGVISLVAFLRERVKESSVKACMLKALTSSLFVGCAAAAAGYSLAEGGADDVGFSFFVLPGLVFGLMGDIWLDLKWVYKNDSDRYTFAGFGAFAIGHLVYIAGLFTKYADFGKPLYVILPLILAAVIAAAVILLEKPMKMVYGKFKKITAVYACILVYMTLLSGSLCIMTGFKVQALVMMFVGGALFLISDLILSGTYFGVGKDRPVDIITNHVAYYAAQFIIASSLFFLA